jgi:hypothetical protein
VGNTQYIEYISGLTASTAYDLGPAGSPMKSNSCVTGEFPYITLTSVKNHQDQEDHWSVTNHSILITHMGTLVHPPEMRMSNGCDLAKCNRKEWLMFSPRPYFRDRLPETTARD